MFPQNHQYRFSISYYNQMNQQQQPLYYFEETNNFTKSGIFFNLSLIMINEIDKKN